MESRPVVIFGNIGSDAGYWYLGADGKIHHVPGWNPETRLAFETIEKNFAILQRASVKVNPGNPGQVTGPGTGAQVIEKA